MSSLYPSFIHPHRDHPDFRDFEVRRTETTGQMLFTKRTWVKGEMMARFDGVTSAFVLQHTLQKAQGCHLHDPWFIGYLGHACEPNVCLDMETQEMWSQRSIKAGEMLTMDYATTEDHLFVCFECQCGSPACRGRITGRKQM